ncbi:MAG: DUF378 domain-containing protein [bacterium]
MKALHKIAFVLVVVGGLNWGLIALGNYTGNNWNVVNLVLGSMPSIKDLVYLLIGVSTLMLVFNKSGRSM